MAVPVVFILFVVGLTLVAVGAALIYLPAGLIVGGALLAVVAAFALDDLDQDSHL